jgi:hypothetical protein
MKPFVHFMTVRTNEPPQLTCPVVRKEIVNMHMNCARRTFCVSQKTNTGRGVKWKFRLA